MSRVSLLLPCLSMSVLLFLVGCGSKVAPPKTLSGPRGINWASEEDDPVPGIDCAAVRIGQWDGKTVFVLWTDIDHSTSAGGMGAKSGDGVATVVTYSCFITLRRNENERLNVECKTKDGAAGVVTMGSQKFELENGRVFLVSTRTNPVTVKQLSRDMGAMELTEDGFKKLAKTDEEIREFFSKTVNTQ